MYITAQDLYVVKKLQAIAKRAADMKPIEQFKTFKEISKKLPVSKN